MRPLLFVLPGIHIPFYSYGVMLVLALAVAYYLVPWLCQREGMDSGAVESINTVTAACALVGAKLLFVATNLQRDSLRALLFSSGGLVAYGALIGGYAGAALYCWRRRLPLHVWADNAVFALCLAFGLVRVGCFLAGCDFGRVTSADAWYAVRFPAGSPAFALHAAQWPDLMAGAARSLPVHPTQIYESLLGFALLPLMVRFRRRRRAPGETFLAFLVCYGAGRLILEGLRGDDDRGSVASLSTSTAIAALSLVVAAALWAYLRRRPQIADVASAPQP